MATRDDMTELDFVEGRGATSGSDEVCRSDEECTKSEVSIQATALSAVCH